MSSSSDGQPGLTQLLKDLESPLEDVRMAALRGLESIPSLAILRAVRRVATTDPSAGLRFEARRFLSTTSEKLPDEEVEAPKSKAKPTSPVERFRALLADPDPAVRVKVIRTLVGNLDAAVPELLASVLPGEKDPFVLCALLQALSATGDRNVQKLITPYLKDPEPRVRASAVEALEAIGDLKVLVRLMPMLRDPHHRVRAVVARAMRAQEREAVLRCVDDMLEAVDDRVVRSALYVLRFFDEETAVARLSEKLGSSSEDSRKMALASLLHLSRKGSVKAGQVLARSRETPSASAVFASVETEGGPVALPLEERFESGDPDTTIQAALEAVRLGRDDLMPRIRTALAPAGDPRLQATLVSAVGRLGAPVDVRALEPFLQAADARLRANAIEAIGLLGAGRSLDLLAPRLVDPGNRARANAIVALAHSPEIDVLPHLRKMAASPTPGFAVSAIWAASTIATPESVEVLAELAAAADPDVATRARNALSALAPVMKEAAAVLARPVSSGVLPSATGVLSESKLQRLIFDLRHESPETRIATVKKIGAVKDPRLLVAVRELLRDPDPTVRRTAREAIRALLQNLASTQRDPWELAKFEQKLVAGEEDARRALDTVLEVATRCGVGPTAEALARRLPVEEHPFVRAAIIGSLALLGDAENIKLIQAFVRDPDARVRANAVDALELAGSEEDLLAAITCLLDSDPRVRAAAIRASAAIDKEVFLGHLRGMLTSQTIADRAAGLYVARTTTLPERFELLREHFLFETQPKLYETCADALSRELTAGRPEDLKALMEQLPDGNKKTYLQQSVMNISQPLSIEVLQAEATKQKESSALSELSSPYSKMMDMKRLGELSGNAVREALARENDPLSISFLLETAADMKLPDVIELAQPFMKSRDRRVRLAAVEALGKLKSADAIESIAAAVRDRDAEVSKRALDQLERLGPDAATQGVKALLESGQPWAMRRGLELLEARGSRELGMPLVLDVLARGSNPGVVEPLSRIVLAWGDAETLERVALLFQRAPANSRPFLLELGTALGQQLGTPPDIFANRFPSELAPSPSEPVHAAARVRGKGASAVKPRFELEARHVAAGVGFAVVLLAIGLWQFWPRERPRSTAGYDFGASAPAVQPSRIVFQTPGKAGGKQPAFSSYSAPPPSGSDSEPELTLQEVEDRMKVALAPQGIKSQAIVHLMALDYFQDAYRYDITRAKQTSKEGNVDGALRILETALAQLEVDHLAGRLAVLLALEEICRRAKRFDRMQEWRSQIKEVEHKLFELCAQAGRESGIPEEKIRAAMVAMDERDKSKGELRAASDFFSGAQIEQGTGGK
ncbi:MAG: HEAT repeat domain-containing protein [Candidatus Wallbacteria bacterium]|nr:HEAT repeat domain-containing protein [Candidatus Wallbacteria bacterium]